MLLIHLTYTDYTNSFLGVGIMYSYVSIGKSNYQLENIIGVIWSYT